MFYCFELNSGNVLWKREAHREEPKSPRHPKSTYACETPTTDGEHLYILFGDVGLYCYDLDGRPLWSHPIEPKKTLYDYGAASPWAYNGKLFFLSEDGVTYVVEAGPEFKQLHTNNLDELCLSSPAACQGKLLVRTASRLYCFSNLTPEMDKEGE